MLKTIDLTHIYMQNSPFEFKALENINLEIKKGVITGIIGPVGGGKSTLIQHFNAILKPTFGKVLVDGEDLNDPKTNLKKIRQKVGLVFQFPETQLFGENIFEDVAFGPRNMGLSEKEVDERVEEALSWVEISFKESKIRSPFSLSGSQMRKVALASIIALHPEVLILDEPTVGLDPKGRKNLLEKIKLLKDNWNLTVILVSHGIEELVYL
ncbi:MAG: energy-coupling factor transporter ATPase, partial [Armatimonadetes bacterium]|nr:energy-coupling factor transporter ATPase [Armatimonadota bacterium]